MSLISKNEPGREVLLMGNEAIARGALEAGISVAAAYPGNPSSEIIESLSKVAKELGIYVEWSVNEKVALEVAAAAAASGLNAIVAMKQNGMNVASDFLLNLNLSGIRGGLVLVACDDPSGISSTNEQDSRVFAKLADLPLLEPATFHDAKDMVREAFALSRAIENVVIVRSVTRISHARGNVVLGPLPETRPAPYFDTTRPLAAMPVSVTHPRIHQRLKQAAETLADSRFNTYQGPDKPELLILACGAASLFAREAVSYLGLDSRVGLATIGTTWPLPEAFLLKHLGNAGRVLFLEEVDPVLENNVKELYADNNADLPRVRFLGKRSGDVPDTGELTPGLVIRILANLMGATIPEVPSDFGVAAKEAVESFAPSRSLAFCAGCPHRASFWAIKKALALDGRDGVVFGDIGCYALAYMATGFYQSKTLHAMGSGAGMAAGFGKLAKFGSTQPAIAVCGDSTFYHAAIPALINGVHHRSDFLLILLDNSATAMTGFQPHPGRPVDAMGHDAPQVLLEDVCRSLGAKTVVKDPFALEDAAMTIYELLQEKGPRCLVLRQECALVRAKKGPKRQPATVDPEKCIGEDCGCNRLCTRVFRCPGLNWDATVGKTKIDEAICTGCGVCADVCPRGAIIKETA
ncbi:MAG: thiamine pyrophosphate-dependent enzyme [Thermodesulfobacteriota bacterium]